MVDRDGFSVQSIFGSILTTQLKAYSFLRMAYNDDPLEAHGLLDAEQLMVAIGQQMAALYPSVTAPGPVNAFGIELAKRHAQTLGDRAYNSYWVTFPKGPDDFNAKPYSARPADGSVESGYLTTMCHFNQQRHPVRADNQEHFWRRYLDPQQSRLWLWHTLHRRFLPVRPELDIRQNATWVRPVHLLLRPRHDNRPHA